MKYIDVDELRTLQLGIMDDISSFCEQNNLRYYLYFGTLLGAIRHKGYIPWDDDFDIAMPRSDYEYFIKHYNKRESVFKVCHHSLDRSYLLPFAKVQDTRTDMWEYMYKKANFGVYIDVFPLDGSPRHGFFRFINKVLNMFLNTKKAILDKNRSKSKNLVMLIGKILLLPFSSGLICTLMDKIGSVYSYESSKFIGLTVLNKKQIIDKSYFNETIFSPFENRLFKIPSGYDGLLKVLYGNYMELPPIDKRVTTHTFKVWWK